MGWTIPLSIVVITACLLRRTGAQTAVLEYRFLEEQPAGALVANLVRDASLHLQYSPTELHQLYFRFITPEGPSDYFHISNGTGELRTTRRIDREIICGGHSNCGAAISLDIAVQPLRFFQVIKVKVLIDDVNDNAPVFPSDHQLVTIAESATIGSMVALPTARDPDAGSNGIRSYRLETPLDEFALQVAPDASDCHLVLRATLDRETTRSYLVHLVAIDGGSPPRSASIAVQVQIVDANDNTPQFDSTTYSVDVEESIEVGSTLLVLHAGDQDAADNGRVSYRLADESEASHGAVFSVNATSGELYLRQGLDHERRAVYQLTVLAEDHGYEPLTAFTKVTVHVRDVNDHAPQITINALTSSNRVELREGEPQNTFVAHVSVIDPDSGEGGRVNCSLDAGPQPYFSLQRLYATEYKVISTTTLDRETRAVYRLQVTCQDGGMPPRIAHQLLVVMVTDLNDHCPTFARNRYKATLSEAVPPGSFVVKVNATDLDTGNNSLITYRVQPSDAAVSVASHSGVVTTSRRLDYEAATRHRVSVVATDGGVPPCSSTAMLVLDVLDVNDEAPRFRFTAYKFATFENQPIGVEVGRVDAQDADSPPYNVVVYSLDQPGDDIFSVDAHSGVITAERRLDREEVSVYYVTVLASNGPGTPTARVVVTIHVADRNDNTPLIDFPNEVDNAIEVSALARVGEIIGHVEARDVDAADNGRLSYLIRGGSGAAIFAIDNASGDISPQHSLQTNADQLYQLDVVVSDQGVPSLHSVAYLNVFVNSSLAKGARGSLMDGSGAALVVVVVATLAVCLALFALAFVVAWRRHRRHKNSASSLYTCRVEASPRTADKTAGERRAEAARDVSWKEDKCCARRSPLHFATPPGGCCQCQTDANRSPFTPPPFSMAVLQSPLTSGGLSPSKNRPTTVGEVATCSVASPRGQPTNYMDEARRRLLYSTPPKTLLVPPTYSQHSPVSRETGADSDGGDSLTDSGRGYSEEGEWGHAHPQVGPAPRLHTQPYKWHKYSKSIPKKSCLKLSSAAPPIASASRYDAIPLSPSRQPQWRHQAELPLTESLDGTTDPSRREIRQCVRDVVGVYLCESAEAGCQGVGAPGMSEREDSDSDESSTTSGSYIVQGAEHCVIAIQRDIFV